jgi:hypothetical protein
MFLDPKLKSAFIPDKRAGKPNSYGSIPTPLSGITGSQAAATVDSGALAGNAERLPGLHPLGRLQATGMLW